MLEPFLSRAYQRPAGRSEKSRQYRRSSSHHGRLARRASLPSSPSAEERSATANGIWLCQNCAKLIDNDVVRFSAEMLKAWKTTAEADAKGRVGRTSQSTGNRPFPLAKYAKIRFTPVVPREHEQSQFMLMEEYDEYLELQKLDSQRYVTIPKSFIENVHQFGHSAPALLRLSGRLQWVSTKRDFELFPDRPPSGPAGIYGIPKDVDSRYAARLGIACKCARKDRLPEVLSQGWLVFYDLD
jgi:hypothetical protein